jgi:phage-related baseplate assembly protein
MSLATFTPIDLSQLPAPNIVEPLSAETIFQAMLTDLQARDPSFTGLVESDPAYKILEVCAFRELLLRQRVNDAARGVMLAFALGTELDHIGALFGVTRLIDDGEARRATSNIMVRSVSGGGLGPAIYGPPTVAGRFQRPEVGALAPVEIKFVSVPSSSPTGPYGPLTVTASVTGNLITVTREPSQSGYFTPNRVKAAIEASAEASELVEVIIDGFGDTFLYYEHLENQTLRLLGGRDAAEPFTEGDVEFRRRIQLSLEGLSVAGPRGAYIFHALSADVEVIDAHAVSPDPGEVVVYIMSRFGNGEASDGLCNAVRDHLNAESIRPLTDLVTVESAEIVEYEIEASIYIFPGPDPTPIIEAANQALMKYIASVRKIGRDVTISGIHAALHQPGVQRVQLTKPSANVTIDPSEVSFCTDINITLAGADE